MIKIYNKCGIFKFEFNNKWEKEHLEVIFGKIVFGFPIIHYELIKSIDYCIKGNKIINSSFSLYSLMKSIPNATISYHGDFRDILEKNGLIFNNNNNKLQLANSFVNQNINFQDKVLGILQVNSSLKAYNGFYDIENNITVVENYETY